MATLLDDTPCDDPARFYRECTQRRLPTDWWGKANFFDLPVGRGPGRGHVLLRYGDLLALDTAADHSLTFSGTDADHVYKLDPVTVLGARCLSPGGEGDTEATFLVEVADRRHHLARIPIDRAYNVYAADGTGYLSATENGGSPWAWQEIVNDLVTTLGLTTAQFTLPFTPDTTPQNLAYWGTFAWDALSDVLDRLACAAKLDPSANTFSVVRLGSADDAAAKTLAALAGDKTWDAFPVDPARAWRPEKVQVQFLRRPRPTDGSSPYYSVDVTLAATAGVVSGSYVQLKDDLTALGATGTPTNSAALSTRATERANDWLRKRSGYGRPFHRIYLDFDPDVPGKALGSTIGRVGLDDRGADDRRGAMRAEVSSKPDRLVEDWTPLSCLPPWFPADASTGSTATSWKAVVRVATTIPGTLASAFAAGQIVDGVTLATGDRILLKDQTTTSENGIYTVNASGAPTRATDADGADELVGAVAFVSEGTANRNTVWACVTDATITPGTTSTVWVQLTPEICEVTVTDTGAGHTVKKKTVIADAVVDVSGPVTFHPCYSATGSALAVGTKVLMVRIPDIQSAANYWIFPTTWDLTVEEADGSPSYSSVTTLQFDQAAFVVSQPGTGKALVSSNFTVQEKDGVPSYSGVTTLQFNQDAAFVVSQPAPGIALVDFTILDTDTVNLTISTSGLTADVRYQDSITADVNGIKFVNDVGSPTADYCYRTNSSGVRGWYPYIYDGLSLTATGSLCWWDSGNDYIAVLSPPTTDGTYTLQCVVTGGTPTISWA